MSRATAWTSHVGAALVAATGIVYGWMRYFAEPADEFAVMNHPWQPEALASHVVLAPLVVFACGMLWPTHVVGRLRGGRPSRRRTGLVLAVLLGPMIFSGYLLQVSVEESWRATWMWTHLVTSVLWTVLYIVHQFLPDDPVDADPFAAFEDDEFEPAAD